MKSLRKYLFNWVKTLYVNFKLLPISQAVHFPIILYGNCYVNIGPNARFFFRGGQTVRSGMVIIGNNDAYVMWPNNCHPCVTFVSINGIIEFTGEKLFIGNGSKFVVRDDATISFGDLCYFTGNNKIVCSKRIILGDMVRMSWDTQVYDTNFHYLYSEDGVVHRRSGEVVVGHHSFIGNRVTLQKGTVLPPYSVVASNSLVNKDLSSFGSAIFGGIPAKFLSSGRKRLFNYAMEYSLDDYFRNNENVEKVQVDLKEVEKYNHPDNFIFTPVE